MAFLNRIKNVKCSTRNFSRLTPVFKVSQSSKYHLTILNAWSNNPKQFRHNYNSVPYRTYSNKPISKFNKISFVPKRNFVSKTYKVSNQKIFLKNNNNPKIDQQIHLGELINLCSFAAQSAGVLIRKIYYSGKMKVSEKSFHDPVTSADRKGQQLIMAILKEKFPQLSYIGEEEVSEVPLDRFKDILNISKKIICIPDHEIIDSSLKNINSQDLCVFIDPLDGTREFTAGLLSSVVTLIGISHKGTPIAGVMYQPFTKDEASEEFREMKNEENENENGNLIWGLVGHGYGSIGDFKFQNLKQTNSVDQIKLTITKSHASRNAKKIVNLLKPNTLIKAGGAGNKTLLLLSGKANLYIHPDSGMKRWDTCSPEAILKSFRGNLTDFNGNFYSYEPKFLKENISNSNGIVASMFSKREHQKIIEKLKELNLVLE